MSASVYGSQSRRPVIYRGERIAGLYERDTGDGRLVYEMRRKVDGKMVRQTLAAQTATDAIREARVAAVKVEDGIKLVGRADVTLGELREAFGEWGTGAATTLAPSTMALYLLRLDKHVLPILGTTTKASAVTPAHLRAMVDKLRDGKRSGSNVRGCVVATSALFRFAVRRGLVASNPVRMLERGDRPSGKRTSEPRYLDRPGIDKLLKNLGDDFRPVAAACAFAGLRISEALSLRWDDIDFKGNLLAVRGTKTAGSNAPVR
jgi:hypothetical protein